MSGNNSNSGSGLQRRTSNRQQQKLSFSRPGILAAYQDGSMISAEKGRLTTRANNADSSAKAFTNEFGRKMTAAGHSGEDLLRSSGAGRSRDNSKNGNRQHVRNNSSPHKMGKERK